MFTYVIAVVFGLSLLVGLEYRGVCGSGCPNSVFASCSHSLHCSVCHADLLIIPVDPPGREKGESCTALVFWRVSFIVRARLTRRCDDKQGRAELLGKVWSRRRGSSDLKNSLRDSEQWWKWEQEFLYHSTLRCTESRPG